MQNKIYEVRRNLIFDLAFSIFLLIVVVVFFIDTFNFHPSARRAPFIALVPLAILIVLNLLKIVKGFQQNRVTGPVEDNHKLKTELAGILKFVLWIVALGVLMYIIGFYAAVLIYLFISLRVMSKEKWLLSVSLSVITPVIIYLMFEILLGMQLYRGLISTMMRSY